MQKSNALLPVHSNTLTKSHSTFKRLEKHLRLYTQFIIILKNSCLHFNNKSLSSNLIYPTSKNDFLQKWSSCKVDLLSKSDTFYKYVFMQKWPSIKKWLFTQTFLFKSWPSVKKWLFKQLCLYAKLSTFKGGVILEICYN